MKSLADFEGIRAHSGINRKRKALTPGWGIKTRVMSVADLIL
jgi:hypothetical protein